ncbi:MAG: bifunctional oligoribonuclease/PAP phosphatase NrnA [Thermodesulfobacteriota bacterium]|nr:bifunctional oligoribonuclease/PAP phosphatase NrnA [Thermodesulfobacteriota bacterium]
MYRTISNHLKGSRNVLVASHIHPDGDAVSAALAMAEGLLLLGKQVTLYNEHPVPQAYQFLANSDMFVNTLPDTGIFDTAIILDCSKISRTGQLAASIEAIPVVINIDHHCSNESFGDLRLVECEASASAEIVYRLLKAMGLPITTDIAYAIYTGIITDTASFSFTNATSAAFAICGEMVEAGVEPHVVSKNVYITYSAERIQLMKMVLETFVVSDNRKVSFMVVTRDMIEKSGMLPENVGRVVNYAKHIENVKVSALALEEENHNLGLPPNHSNFHVSLRSDGSVDVSKIAMAYGGGGHHRASGFNIADSIEGVKATILGMADEI